MNKRFICSIHKHTHSLTHSFTHTQCTFMTSFVLSEKQQILTFRFPYFMHKRQKIASKRLILGCHIDDIRNASPVKCLRKSKNVDSSRAKTIIFCYQSGWNIAVEPLFTNDEVWKIICWIPEFRHAFRAHQGNEEFAISNTRFPILMCIKLKWIRCHSIQMTNSHI